MAPQATVGRKRLQKHWGENPLRRNFVSRAAMRQAAAAALSWALCAAVCVTGQWTDVSTKGPVHRYRYRLPPLTLRTPPPLHPPLLFPVFFSFSGAGCVCVCCVWLLWPLVCVYVCCVCAVCFCKGNVWLWDVCE